MAAPIDARDFAALMAACGLQAADGPVAVAVSGGADSMALTLLAAGWGQAVALTVDHGLRPASADEARQVAGWLQARGIDHHTLTWRGDKPASGVQAAARQARYGALEGWCRDHGVGTLLLAHHRQDQAETFLLRLLRGSGVDGLAAMAAVGPPITGHDRPRLVRPLLDVSKARLRATLEAAGQPWLEDPSNQDTAFDRVRVRRLLADPPLEGLTVDRLADTARRLRRARLALEQATEALLDRAATPDPSGFCLLDTAALAAAPGEIALRALSRVLTTVGGRLYPPRLEPLERLWGQMRQDGFAGATLAGCQLAPLAGRVLVCREPEAATERLALAAGQRACWDGRFEVGLPAGDAPGTVAALGEAGWQDLVARQPGLRGSAIPFAARLSLPALWRDGRMVCAPHMDPAAGFQARFCPRRPLSPSVETGMSAD